MVALGGEVRRPGWTVPRALIGGILIVIALYLLINAAYFYVLTPAEVACVPESSTVAFETASRFMGPITAALMSACLMVSAYGTLHAGILTGSRVPFTVARAGLMPRVLGELSTHGVPVFAVIGLGAWSCALALSGTFDVLTDMYIFVMWVFYGMNGAAVFVLRRKLPDAGRPYRVWGYPVVPALFLLVTAFLLVNTVTATPHRALTGVGMIVAGLPVYWYYARRAPVDAAQD